MSVTTLALAKQHLKIAHTAQDLVIQALLDGAEDWVARWCGVALSSSAREEDVAGGDIYLWPTFAPVTALNIPTGYTRAQILDNVSNSYVPVRQHRNRIARADANGVATVECFEAGVGRYHIKYTGGYAAIPPAMTQAILQLVSRGYYQRSGQASESAAGAAMNWGNLQDSGILQLLWPFRQNVSVSV